LWTIFHRWALGLDLFDRPPVANELVNGWHETSLNVKNQKTNTRACLDEQQPAPVKTQIAQTRTPSVFSEKPSIIALMGFCWAGPVSFLAQCRRRVVFQTPATVA
jgi:dienelactone hydrolase